MYLSHIYFYVIVFCVHIEIAFLFQMEEQNQFYSRNKKELKRNQIE